MDIKIYDYLMRICILKSSACNNFNSTNNYIEQ